MRSPPILVGPLPGPGPAPSALPAVLVVVPRWATAFADPWEPPPPQAAATRARPHTTKVPSPARQARPWGFPMARARE